MDQSDLWTNLRRWAWSGLGLAGMAVVSAGPMSASAFGGDTKSCAATCIPPHVVQKGKVSCTTTAIPYVCTTASGKNSCADVCVPPSAVTVGSKGSCTDVCIPTSCVTQSAIANPDLLPTSPARPVSMIQQAAAVQPQQPIPSEKVVPATVESKPATPVDVDPFADWLPAGAKSQQQPATKTADLFNLPTKSVPEQPKRLTTPAKKVAVAKPVEAPKSVDVCLVALRVEKRLVPVNKSFAANYGEKTYYFSSAKALTEFQSNPDAYVPVANGHDVVAQVGHQQTAAGSVEHALWFRNRLYLFANAANATQFVNNPTQFVVTK